jgi:hypothetical protein
MKHSAPPAAHAFNALLNQMERELVPIPLVLDMWSLGHSAGDIAKRLAIPGGHKGVTRIVEHARELGDKRAVLHCGASGRLLGRPGRDGTKIRRGAKTVHGKEVAMLIPKPPPAVCKYGHDRRGTKSGQRCRECHRLVMAARRAAKKGAP